MVEFKGELSKECKKFYDKLFIKVVIVTTFISCIILLIPSIVLSFYNDIFIISDIIFAIFPLFVFLSIKTKKTTYSMPNYIKITDKNEIIIKGERIDKIVYINNVKSVYDYEYWYLIKCSNIFNLSSYVCQKDLIKNGTLEDFEKIFEGKIIRKTK